jgi:hypothetical protein
MLTLTLHSTPSLQIVQLCYINNMHSTTKQLNNKTVATYCKTTNTVYYYKVNTPFYTVTANNSYSVQRNPSVQQLAQFNALPTTLQYYIQQRAEQIAKQHKKRVA